MIEKKPVIVYLTQSQIDHIDIEVRKGKFESRSHYIRLLVDERG